MKFGGFAMLNGDTKKIVVIRDIPSNLIEEAILILKADPGKKESPEKSHKATGKSMDKNNDYLIKEAEMIINSYIKGAGSVGSPKPGVQARPKKEAASPERKKFVTNIVINAALVGSITILIFLVSNLMK